MNSIISRTNEVVKCESQLPRKIISKVPENKGHSRHILVDKYIGIRSNNGIITMRCVFLTDKENSLYYKKLCLKTPNFYTDCEKKSVEKLPKTTMPDAGVGGGVISSVASTLCLTPEGEGEFSNKKERYTIGFDTEWGEVNGARHLLSYQFAMYVPAPDGNEDLIEFILFPDGHRLKLDRLLSIYTWQLREEFGLPIGPTPESYNNNVVCYLVPHYSIADLTTFSNSKEILRNTDTIRRTQTTVTKPLLLDVWDKNYNYMQRWVVFIRDTMHLSPANSSLEKLAIALGKKKLELPEGYDKNDMGKLLKEQEEEFMLYAANDATIALDYIKTMYPDRKRVPVTLGSDGAEVFRGIIMKNNSWKIENFDFHFRGLMTVKEDSKGEKKLIPRPEAVAPLEIASHAYYGGRNECFIYGIHNADEWNDYDLSGAYPTAMAMLQNPDFSKVTTLTGDIITMDPLSYTFGLIDFEFPENTMYPCLPIKDPKGRGLVFPLRGRTYASAPEIYAALKMGAKIRWVQVGIQVGTSDRFDMGEALADLLKARAEAKKVYGKGSVQELRLKEMVNSIYGKLAQGLARKRSYSTRTDSVNDLPPSIITQPMIASMVTSLVRAIVSVAMHQLHERGFRIASVTTDGFLTDAPYEVLNSLNLFGFKSVYEAVRNTLVGDPTVWEIKHKARSLVMVKTRGSFGLEKVDNYDLPVARAGYRPEPDFFNKYVGEKAVNELARRFLERKGKIEMEFYKLPSPKEYYRKGADGLATLQKKRIDWEYDLKRKPVNPRMEEITIEGKTYKHLAFDTVPWNTIQEFDNARAVKDTHKELFPLKSIESFDMLMSMIRDKEAATESGMFIQNAEVGGIYRTAVISYLRDLLSGREVMPSWMIGKSYKQLAEAFNERLKSLNVFLTVDDFKNAKRRSNKGRLENSQALEIVKSLLKD